MERIAICYIFAIPDGKMVSSTIRPSSSSSPSPTTSKGKGKGALPIECNVHLEQEQESILVPDTDELSGRVIVPEPDFADAETSGTLSKSDVKRVVLEQESFVPDTPEPGTSGINNNP